MIKILSVLIIGIILNDCTDTIRRSDIYAGETISEELINRIRNLDLLSSDDEIIGLWFSITNEASANTEDYTFFTAHRLIRYYHFGDKEPLIIEIPINKILNLEKHPDPIDTNRLLIKLKRLKTISFNERKQQDEIFDEEFDFRPPYDSQKIKQERFFQLLVDTWINNSAHEEMQNVYRRFYHENGSRLLTTDQEFARIKLRQLQQEIEKLPFSIVNHDDFFVAYHEREVYLFRYDYVDNKFTIFHVITKDKIEDDIAATSIIISIYPIHRHEQIALPYTNRGYTINKAFKHYETEIEQILEKHIN
jgi:hypothetical protein